MKKRLIFILVVTHLLAIAMGFAAGIYALPILIAPSAPEKEAVALAAKNSLYYGEFSRDRKDSDALHWGEGEISIGQDSISLSGSLSPGPDYKLYLSPEFVETESEFNRLKSSMVRIGDIKTFDNFIVPLPENIDLTKYNAVIVWCETFGEFITSATYTKKPS